MHKTAETLARVTLRIEWPEDTLRWLGTHGSLAQDIEKYIINSQNPLTEATAWEAVAASYSPEWADAYRKFCTAESLQKEKSSPENEPLGLLGQIMDSQEILALENNYTEALIPFTLINEQLRENDGLHKIYNHLLQQRQHINDALEAAGLLKKPEPATSPPSALGLSAVFRHVKNRLSAPVNIRPPAQTRMQPGTGHSTSK